MDTRPIMIGFGARKGGEGKTFGAVNIAGELASRGKRVLVVVCDQQGDLSGRYLVDQDPDEKEFLISGNICLSDVIAGRADISDAIYQSRTLAAYTWSESDGKPFRTRKGSYRLDIIPPGDDIYRVAEYFKIVDGEEVPRFRLFDEILAPVFGNYDYVIFDIPPFDMDISMCAYAASDVLMVPFASIDSLDSLLKMSETVDMLNAIPEVGHPVHIQAFVNKNKPRRYLIQQMKEILGASFEDCFLHQEIRFSVIAEDAKADGTPLASFQRSPLAYDVSLLTDELLDRMRSFRSTAGRVR